MKNATIASLVLLLVPLSGCINGAGMSSELAQGRATDDELQGRLWNADGRSPSLTGILGDPSSGGDGWPGPVEADVAVADIDGDGSMEVVVHNRDRHVYVYSTDGEELAKLPVRYPPSWRIGMVLNAPAVDNLEPGAPNSIIVATPAAYVTAWTYDAKNSQAGSMAFTQAWEVRANECHRNPGMDAPAVIANIDGKPGKEVLIQTEQVGFYAYSSSGKLLWKQCWAGGNGGPAVDDLDGDGRVDVVFASDSGFISVIDGASGHPQWTFDAADKKYGIMPASVTVPPTIGELDGKYPREVLFTARHVPSGDESKFEDYHMAIFAVRQASGGGSELVWMRQPDWANPLSYTQLVVEDVDGDGRGDVFGMDWNTVGHNPGEWQVLDAAHAFRLDDRGQDVWVRELDTWWSNKDIVVADVDGDGEKEMLINAPKGTDDAIWRLDTATGSTEGALTMHPWRVSKAPVLFTHQGGLFLAIPCVTEDETTGGVLVFDLDTEAP